VLQALLPLLQDRRCGRACKAKRWFPASHMRVCV